MTVLFGRDGGTHRLRHWHHKALDIIFGWAETVADLDCGSNGVESDGANNLAGKLCSRLAVAVILQADVCQRCHREVWGQLEVPAKFARDFVRRLLLLFGKYGKRCTILGIGQCPDRAHVACPASAQVAARHMPGGTNKRSASLVVFGLGRDHWDFCIHCKCLDGQITGDKIWQLVGIKKLPQQIAD